jgi:photosystem II stability/assembly factor-like uncharacterized protein
MNRLARRQFLAACAALPLPAQSTDRQPVWTPVFFHDADEQQLDILEISFYSNRAAMGIALLDDKGRAKPASVRTTDAGKTWSMEGLKPAAWSVRFLDEAIGWLAATNGIYKSTDAGRNWRRVLRNSLIRHVYFVDPSRGFAVGRERTALETSDGGKTWTEIAAAASYNTNKEYTHYRRIAFGSPKLGFLVGSYDPPRTFRRELPAWMDPAPKGRTRRQTPTLSLVVQTLDGGKVWKPTSSSIFGHITRLSMNDRGVGLALVEFEEEFEYASEVYLINLSTGKTDQIFRASERAITDVLALKDGGFLLAGVEAPGRLRQSPVPGKVHILKGNGEGNWSEMEVDYRAAARRVRLCESPTGQLFAATDAGMILRLEPDANSKT